MKRKRTSNASNPTLTNGNAKRLKPKDLNLSNKTNQQKYQLAPTCLRRSTSLDYRFVWSEDWVWLVVTEGIPWFLVWSCSHESLTPSLDYVFLKRKNWSLNLLAKPLIFIFDLSSKELPDKNIKVWDQCSYAYTQKRKGIAFFDILFGLMSDSLRNFLLFDSPYYCSILCFDGGIMVWLLISFNLQRKIFPFWLKFFPFLYFAQWV